MMKSFNRIAPWLVLSLGIGPCATLSAVCLKAGRPHWAAFWASASVALWVLGPPFVFALAHYSSVHAHA